MTKRALRNCILALGLAALLAGCAPAAPLSEPDASASPAPSVSSGPEAEGTELSLAVFPGQSLHPVLSSDRTNLTLAPLLYEGLFQLDTSFTPQPVLCRSYSVSEDGLTWTFTLQEGVTFSDGTPLTAELTAQALELARSEGSQYAGRFSHVSSMAADPEGRLVITLSRANGALPALLDVPIALGAGDRPLGTGPYVLTGSGNDLALTARTDWWQGASLPQQTIPLHAVSRSEELSRALADGAVSLVSTDPSAVDAVGYEGACATVDYDTTSLIYLGFHTGRSPFHTSAARAALSAALDRTALVSTAWSGHARATTLPIHPASALYDTGIARQSSGRSAQELLEEAGLTGRTVTLIVNTESTAKVTAARTIARQLKQAGLTVTVSALNWSEYLSALSSGQFDLYLGEVVLTADFDLSRLVGSGGSLNYTRWSSAQADSLLRAFQSAPASQRREAANALCGYLAEQSPIAPLCFERGSVLSRWEGAARLTPTRANVFYGWSSGLDREEE